MVVICNFWTTFGVKMSVATSRAPKDLGPSNLINMLVRREVLSDNLIGNMSIFANTAILKGLDKNIRE